MCRNCDFSVSQFLCHFDVLQEIQELPEMAQTNAETCGS